METTFRQSNYVYNYKSMDIQAKLKFVLKVGAREYWKGFKKKLRSTSRDKPPDLKQIIEIVCDNENLNNILDEFYLLYDPIQPRKSIDIKFKSYNSTILIVRISRKQNEKGIFRDNLLTPDLTIDPQFKVQLSVDDQVNQNWMTGLKTGLDYQNSEFLIKLLEHIFAFIHDTPIVIGLLQLMRISFLNGILVVINVY